MKLVQLPQTAWRRIWGRTILVTSLAALVSLLLVDLFLSLFSRGLNLPGTLASLLMPFIIGGPTMFYHQVQSELLRLANEKLEVLASTDWLTACLNRRAFTNRVSAALGGEAAAGGFLVIDADHFKTINDQFGHERGDEVLQRIADSIRAALRDGDVAGRLGGEEFGVFLKDASYETTRAVAERIRRSVNGICLRGDALVHRVSVSIGASVYQGRNSFAELFRLADQRLYAAKQAGRNRTELVRAGARTELAEATALVA